jgi:hypothetical protein
MLNQIKNTVKTVLALLGLVFSFFVSQAQECLSLGTSTWGDTANWSCDGVNRLPTCGDTVKIQTGDTVTVDNQYNLLGCGPAMIVDVTGTLQFTTGNKLDLPCGSIFSIQKGGVVRKSTAGGGNSTLISICGSNIWTAGMGELNTPQSFGGEILPVELIGFEGELIDQNAHLTWSTATEQKSDYYSLYRSDEGSDWEFVKDVMASGNSNIRKDYSYIVYGLEGKTLFKLEQTDWDGTTKPLAIVELNGAPEENYQKINVYPNPTSSIINFQGLPSQFKGVFSLFDITGNLVYQTSIGQSLNNLDLREQGLKSGIFSGVLSCEAGVSTFLISLSR